jgi:inner membrane protein
VQKMDNLTHTLTGIALGQAGLKHKTRYAMLALIIASNLPDADIMRATRGSVDYLAYHRGITHSLLGLTGLAVILAAAIFFLGRKAVPKKHAPPVSLKWLFLICWIATACHVLMDFTNQYGVRLFLPFSDRWVAWDIMPIVGPYLLFLLIVGLGFPAILKLVTEEVGAGKSASKTAQKGAIISLCAMVALWGLHDFSHRRALGMLNARLYGEEIPLRSGAFPSPLNPFQWNGVVETASSYYLLDVDALMSNIDTQNATRLYKPAPSPALVAAKKSRAARIFLDFARFPLATVRTSHDEGFEVYLRDLRFATPGSHIWRFVMEIDLDSRLQVRGQSFSFVRDAPVR